MVTTRYGDADQVEVKMTVFDEISFGGDSMEITAEGLNLGSPTTFRSYFFTGPNSWTYDSVTEGTTCLNHSFTGTTYGVTYSAAANLANVTSFDLGCGGVDPTRTTVQPTTGPTTTQNTASTVTTTGNPIISTTIDPDLSGFCENRPDGRYLNKHDFRVIS